MSDILRRIMSVLAAIFLGIMIISGFEYISEYIYPHPKGFNFKDRELLASFIRSMPLAASLVIISGYAVSSFVGGIVATVIAKTGKPNSPLLVGTLFTATNIINTSIVPHPMWFVIVSSCMFLPMSFLGYYLIRKRVLLAK